MDKILLEIYKKRHPRYIAKHSRFTKGKKKSSLDSNKSEENV